MVEGKGVWILKEGIFISEERFWMRKGYGSSRRVKERVCGSMVKGIKIMEDRADKREYRSIRNDAENEMIWIQEEGEEGEGYGSGIVGQMARYIDLSDQKQNLMLI